MKDVVNDIVVEGVTPVSQVITYLEQLVHALKVGAVHVRHGDHEVVLGSRDVVWFAVNAKARDKRHRLALELTWRRKTVKPGGELELSFAPGPRTREAVADEVTADAAVTAESEPSVEPQTA